MHSNEEGMGRESHDGGERASRDVSPTHAIDTIGALNDAELLTSTRQLTCQSNRVLAALLAHLAEVEARGLHRTRACATLFTYCVYELRMSEDAAYRRVAAARLVKRFPPLFGAVERGEIHLTGLLQLGPHLTEANLFEVLARAQFRTKKEIEKLVRVLSPLPDVPSRIEPLGLDQRRSAPRATWANVIAARLPVRELLPHERPVNWLPSAEAPELPARDSVSQSAPAPARIDAVTVEETAAEPQRVIARACAANETPARGASARSEQTPEALSGPQRYSVQFTAGEEYVALVEEAKALLAHAMPAADLAEIHLRALRTLVAELKKRKYASPARRVEASPVTRVLSGTPTAPAHAIPLLERADWSGNIPLLERGGASNGHTSVSYARAGTC